MKNKQQDLKYFNFLIYTFIHFVILLSTTVSEARESLVKADSVVVTGGSAPYNTETSTLYGGAAGNACSSSDNVSTCNSCENVTTLQACNTTSVYATMAIGVSFNLSKDVATSSKAAIYVGTGGSPISSQMISGGAGTTISFQIHWSDICNTNTATSNCTCTDVALVTQPITFGVDSDASGDIESEERKTITANFHCVPAVTTDTSKITQAYCPTTAATGSGLCAVELQPGDEKAYITSKVWSSAGASTANGTLEWDGVVFFPVPVANGADGATTATDQAAYTNFTLNQASPIIKDIGADGSISDSKITGSFSNYNRYCFVYANKNKAQNIYLYVTDAAAASYGCIVPSEVVGVLDDKHCFISTAAFGSEMAQEVQIFRKFRNQFLLTNFLGKKFVKYYYQYGPQVASSISQSEVLKAVARSLLYPVLAFCYVALEYGFTVATLVFLVLLILLMQVRRFIRLASLKLSVFILICIVFSQNRSQAEIQQETQYIQHPEAADGLVKIKPDGTYVYDIKRQMKNRSSRLSIGQATHPEISIDIEQTDAQGQTTGSKTFIFDDFYTGASQAIFGYSYEWFPWVGKGKLGLQGGVSLMYASGHGRLVAAPNNESVEEFTFLTVPMDLGAIYRLEWKDRQLFAPYVAGGGTYVGLLEKREDKNKPNVAGGFGAYALGGLLVNLSFIEDETGMALENEYGISNLWFSIEFKVVEVSSDAFGFSNQYLNAGLSFDF